MKYIISWKEEENTFKFEPSQVFNAEGKVYILKKISNEEFVLKSENEETHSSLGGCLNRLKNEMDTEDFINIASLLYFWGIYNGVHG
jgi:hypothetical protein